jgi:serine/threonine protein kinase
VPCTSLLASLGSRRKLLSCSLCAELDVFRPLGDNRITDWTCQLLSALDYLHRGQDDRPIIVHRDIKPDNILLDRAHKTLKIGDFGVGKMLVDHHAPDKKELSKESGGILERCFTMRTGTCRYMAPEVSTLLCSFCL